MGVNGLWQVVQPCARPTNLATLNRKRLAVDASIWIYQFLKAVRDKDGNALRSSHVVGFFRRICKLLWFGIQPVFVFDGGAPALKRQTILNRKRRREGHREDAKKTAGKLLVVQMQRYAEGELEKERRRKDPSPEEEVPDLSKVVYVAELGMSEKEREKKRAKKFFRQDAYHLPELDGSIANMGNPDDPRIMSIEELEEYARQFNSGRDIINLYDFSKIDFEGDFFKSLPPADRYNILNAARLRSRLRMGLSKDQLEDMFPNRMDFSRFQIERVRERNMLTQRLMRELGMAGAVDANFEVNARIAGEKNREYILVKNEGVEGGWALGVVSKEKDIGEQHKPIDVDALEYTYQSKNAEQEVEDDDDDEEFEDVPIPGLNRLPPIGQGPSNNPFSGVAKGAEADETLFVGQTLDEIEADLLREAQESSLHPEEQAEINKAIALSLKSHQPRHTDDEDELLDDLTTAAPAWEQKSAEATKPIAATKGSIIARLVNNRANAAVSKKREEPVAKLFVNDGDSDSDDGVDFQEALAMSRKANAFTPLKPRPNVKAGFDGPLPFPKLNWKQATPSAERPGPFQGTTKNPVAAQSESDDDMAGGFERKSVEADSAPKPLPPWLVDDSSDIRESLKQQAVLSRQANDADRELAQEEERAFRKRYQEELVEIVSSSDDDSDIEIVDGPPLMTSAISSKTQAPAPDWSRSDSRMQQEPSVITLKSPSPAPEAEAERSPPGPGTHPATSEEPETAEAEDSDDAEFEDVPIPDQEPAAEPELLEMPEKTMQTTEVEFVNDHGINQPAPTSKAPTTLQDTAGPQDEYLFNDEESLQGFSSAEEDELVAQMQEEQAEHARFAAELNNKTEGQTRRDFEKELKQLQSQQRRDKQAADEVSDNMVPECQALLRLFGIPYITAQMEAEAQCAELVRLGLVDGIVTDDSDIFLFGGTRVYKNMFSNGKFVECYLGQDLERDMSLSRDQLIALAQLLGSDYTEGLPGVGPVTAVELVAEFPGTGGLDEFREWWMDVQSGNRPKDADAASPFRRKFRKSYGKKLFLPPGFPSPAVTEAYLKPAVDDSNETFQWGLPDVEGLRQFLMATIGWDKERTDEVLLPVVKDMNRREAEGTQSNITRFFQGGLGAGAAAVEGFAPRERGKKSKRMGDAVAKLKQKTLVASSVIQPAPKPRPAKGKKGRKRAAPVDLDEGADEDAADYDGPDGSASDVELSEEIASVTKRRNRGKRTKT